jgi:iron(II)-dependent oxidoreductase
VSDRRGAALLLLLVSTACPGKAADDGPSLLLAFKRNDKAPYADHLILTWVGDNLSGETFRVPLSGSLPSDAFDLGTYRVALRETNVWRSIVARGYAGENVVSEGAKRVLAGPDVDQLVPIELLPGQLPDRDGDGFPDGADSCETEPNPSQGPCLIDAGADAQEIDNGISDAQVSPDFGPLPPDAGAPDVLVPPDLPPGKLPRGSACLSNDDCDSGRCADSRVGHFCASPGMVVVPAGPFMRGCLSKDTQCQADEQPLRTIMLSAFEVDQTEVTQSQYDACIKAGMCAAPSGFNAGSRPNNPVSNTSWSMARTYCQWAGKRLPTEAEWEKAARGPGANIYPWGDQAPDCSHAQYKGCGLADSVPVAQLAGTSGYGVEDMAGNVAEWVSDVYSSGYYAGAPATDPTGPNGGSMHGRRGGGFTSDPPALRTSARASGDVATAIAGIRCARGL